MNEPHPIRRYREANKLTLQEAGALLGVTAATISRWENGTRKPSHDDLQKIEAKLGISIGDVVNAARPPAVSAPEVQPSEAAE